MKMYMFLIILSGSLAMSKKTNAQTKEQLPQKTVFYSVGAGGALIPEFEGSKDFRVLPLVNFSVNWINGKYIRVNGLNSEVNILANRKWNFGPTLTAKINRNDKVENLYVARLPKLNLAIGAGIFGKYTCKNIDVKGSYSHDISGVNNGGLLGLEVGYTYKRQKLISRVALNTSFATSKYLNTYFGVDDEGSQMSGLSNYKLDSGFKDIGTSASLIYMLNKTWMLGTVFRYNLLIGDVEDSPVLIDGSKHQVVTVFFAMYRF